jgi:hypothetical protein
MEIRVTIHIPDTDPEIDPENPEILKLVTDAYTSGYDAGNFAYRNTAAADMNWNSGSGGGVTGGQGGSNATAHNPELPRHPRPY